MLLPLPDDVDALAAAHLADNAADGYRTVAPHLADRPGAPVLVVGGLGQSVGLFAVQAALALGACEVVYTDSDPTRLDLAAKLGARTRRVVYDGRIELDGQYPITVDACTLPEGRRLALLSTERCGVCTSISNGIEKEGMLPLDLLYKKGIRYEIGRVHSGATMARMLDHVCKGELHPEQLVGRVARFEEAPEAMLDPLPKLVFTRE
jgi:alcohol dehydrogenase